jgi:hypothetical protein
MNKSPLIRLSDSINYIQENISTDLANQVRKLIAGKEPEIGALLHLCQKKIKGIEKRRALRSLLLCQYVYYSAQWVKMTGRISTLSPVNYLSSDWKESSICYWASQSELEIREGLRAYIVTSSDIADAANAANRWVQSDVKKYNFISAPRQKFSGMYNQICYVGVMVWLFNSGLVSLPWLLRFSNANRQVSLTQAFGPGMATYYSAEAISNNSFSTVPRGYIVHIYKNVSCWNGHWMISQGNGMAVGVNNNDESPPVSRTYCNHLSIKKQLMGYQDGYMVVINPRLIPAVL